MCRSPARAVATRMCGDRQYDGCTAPVRLEPPGTDAVWFLPRPQPVCYGVAYDYDRAQLDAMPALYRAWARTSLGEGATRLDRRQAIGDAIRQHNNAASPVPPAAGSGDAGAPSDGGVPVVSSMGGGCSCNLAGSTPLSALPLLLGAIALLTRRSLRRR